MATLTIQPEIIQRIKALQQLDPEIAKIRGKTLEGKKPDFQVLDDGMVRFRGRLCVPNDEESKKEILSEAHRSKYSIHLGNTKCIVTSANIIGKHISKCLTCQQVKAIHCKPPGLLTPLEIANWKWEHITTRIAKNIKWSLFYLGDNGSIN